MRRRFSQVGLRIFVVDQQQTPSTGKIVHAEPHTDGYAVTACNGIYLGDPSLDSVMEGLNHRGAVVHDAPASHDRPSSLVQLACDTARTLTCLLYQCIFR